MVDYLNVILERVIRSMICRPINMTFGASKIVKPDLPAAVLISTAHLHLRFATAYGAFDDCDRLLLQCEFAHLVSYGVDVNNPSFHVRFVFVWVLREIVHDFVKVRHD